MDIHERMWTARAPETVGRKYVATNFAGDRACLTSTQYATLFGRRKGRHPRPIGCGSSACVYPSPDPNKVVKITSDPQDVMAMAEAQGIPGVATLFRSRRLVKACGPYYGMVMERLKPIPEQHERSWNYVMTCMLAAGARRRPTKSVVRHCCHEIDHRPPLQRSQRQECPRFTSQLYRALDGLYERRIGHSDWHAGNVGQDKHGNWKVLDMGGGTPQDPQEPPELHGPTPKQMKYVLWGAGAATAGLLAYAVAKKKKKQAVYVSMTAAERRRMSQLAPDVRAAFEAFLYAAAARGLRIRVGRTQGNVAKTQAHNQAGRSDVSLSWHDLNPPRAIDIYVYAPGGRLVTSPKSPAEIELYRRALRLAECFGFRQIAFKADGSRRFLSSGAWDAFHIEHRGPYRNVQAAARATGVKYA